MKLLDYIRGLRKGKEAHRLEKESMRNPFLADAMDGYQQVEGKHEERIKELQTLITARSTKKRNSYAITWSIAACLIIGVGISSYFLFLKNNMPEDTFIAKETTNTTTVTPEIPTAPDTPEEEVIHSPSAPKMKQDSNYVAITDKEIKKDRFAKSKVVTTPARIITPTMEEITGPTMIEEKALARAAIDTVTLPMDENKLKTNKLTATTNQIIRGKVTDENGEPLIGVNITYGQTGRERGTITDINGKFSFKKEKGDDKISFGYIGYDPMKIAIDTTQPMLIAMKESTQSKLDKVVITGTGAQKKMTVTGAVTTVKVENLKKAPSSNALAGSISKVDIENLKKASKQIMPKPVIGMKQYQKHLKKNLIQPTDATCSGIKGTVILTFLVNEKGRPFQIKIKKGLCESADKEAIRLIQEGPDWTHGNEPVEITIKFK